MREDRIQGMANEPPLLLGLAPGSEVAGFIIEGLLASGSFGSVFRAKRVGRLFAIKLVPMNGRGDREVDALRRVRHPNVVGFHGYGLWPHEKPRFLVLALELVEGRPLEVWAPEENPTALELVSQVLRPLAGTLAAVHAEGVVHRDVKEANVVMRESDGQPVLVDFGAAGYEGAPRLTMRLPPGTPEYRSPEALRFAREWEGGPYPPGPGDDLWALGVTTYWLLTRTLPFGDRYNLRLVQAILEEPPIPPHELNSRVPRALGELCMRMLEKAPEARFADAGKLAEALEEAAALADDSWRVPLFPGGRKEKRPVPVPPPAVREHSPSQRWPWAVGLVFAAAVLLGVPPEVSPLTELILHHTTPQDSFGQEFDSADMTGEVVSGAEPPRSSTPAPIACAMHSEEHRMLKNRKTRSLFAAACVAGSACASGPQPRLPPKPAECPPGAAEVHVRYGLNLDGQYEDSAVHGVTLLPFGKVGIVPVREGAITAEILGPWGTFPDWTIFSGRFFFGQGRVYGRFTSARLPGGETVPVCMQVTELGVLGAEALPGSTAQEARVDSSLTVRLVRRFE